MCLTTQNLFLPAQKSFFRKILSWNIIPCGNDMNYRHSYHAGSFTDVFKHIILVSLIQSLLRKDTPFCYLETHAGTGCYDLFSEAAQKSLEFEGGIKKILAANDPPPLIQDYLSCVMHLNKPNELR